MSKAIIVYGSTTGTTEDMSQIVAQGIKASEFELTVKKVSDSTPEELMGYDLLVLGCSTWGDGDLQDDFVDFEKKLRATNLRGKKAAVFGPGESSYPQFCKSVDILEETLYRRIKSRCIGR